MYNNPNWDWTTFNYDSDAALVDQALSPKINATNPDLTEFQNAGHKLIATQGWKDTFNAQTMPIDYFNSVVITLKNGGQDFVHAANSRNINSYGESLRKVQDFYRLFMVPGMGHCGANAGGLTSFDAVTALINRVEKGVAPDTLPATGTPTAGVTIARNLCPYPQIIKYTGEGSDAGIKLYVRDGSSRLSD